MPAFLASSMPSCKEQDVCQQHFAGKCEIPDVAFCRPANLELDLPAKVELLLLTEGKVRIVYGCDLYAVRWRSDHLKTKMYLIYNLASRHVIHGQEIRAFARKKPVLIVSYTCVSHPARP